jgi:beta-1,4-mannosyltransferase
VALFPYPAGLNSGALLLAMTYGVPAVVPAGGGLAEVIDERFAGEFQAGDVKSLARAIEDARRLVTDEARAAAAEKAHEVRPAVVGEQFAAGVRARLAIR